MERPPESSQSNSQNANWNISQNTTHSIELERSLLLYIQTISNYREYGVSYQAALMPLTTTEDLIKFRFSAVKILV